MQSDDWTDEEQSALDGLPSEREPSALLRTRTIAELRQRGLLQDAPHRRPAAARRARSRVSIALGVALAVSLVFLAGGAVGYRIALRTAAARATATARIAATTVPATASAPAASSDRHVVWF